MEGIYSKIIGQDFGLSLGAALRHSFGGPDGQAQAYGVSESVAFAAGSDLLAMQRSVATLAILTQFTSQKGLGRHESDDDGFV